MSAERVATLARPELAHRLERVRSGMEAADIDVLFVGHSVDLEYLLGVDRRLHHYGASHFFGEWAVGAIIRPDGDPILLVPRHMAEFHFDISADPPRMRVFTEKDAPDAILQDAIGAPPHTIGVNVDAPAELVLTLQRLFPNAKVRLATDIMAGVRAVKSPAEIAAMSSASLLVDRVFEESLAMFRPELTEVELAEWIVKRMKELGAIDESFDTAIFPMGAREARPAKERLSKRRIGTDISVSYDFGAGLAGYCSDFGRTIYVGEPSARFRQAYDAVIASQAAGAAALRPGARASEVDAIARKVIADAGFGEHFRHRLGHGIGKDVHEAPYLDVVDDTELRENMVFTIEPSIFITGEFGARVEDVYVVTKDGGTRLNRASSQLVTLG
jgi:Xaa-Pro aminopeptidase